MTLEQLRTLAAIVESGSFRKAAACLCRSQSAVSKTIKTLENQHNIELFCRDTYRAELTDQGKAFYQKSLSVLNAFDELNEYSHQLSSGVEPELHVAINHICPMPALLNLLGQCQEQHTATTVTLNVESMYGALNRLLNSEAHIAITFIDHEQDELESVRVGSVDLLTVVSASKFSDKQRPSQEIYDKLPQILIEDSSQISVPPIPHVSKHAKQWWVNDFLAKKEIIQSGLGWGRLPAHFIEEDISASRLVELSPPVNVPIYVVKQKTTAFGPTGGWLWERLMELQF